MSHRAKRKRRQERHLSRISREKRTGYSIILFIIFCVCVFYLYEYYMLTSRVSGPLKLELLMVVSPHIGAGGGIEPGPLQEQLGLLTAESSLLPQM